MRLTDFTVLSFDCYGTLIDWETGIWDAFQPLLEHNGGVRVTRDDILSAFGAAEHDIETSHPAMRYPDILSRAHGRVARQLGLRTDAGLARAFGASIPQWPAFPDTAEALRTLERHFTLVILSNVSRDAFAASNRKLGVAFDAVYTAEDIGSYKPALRNFEYMLDRLRADHGVSPGQVLHTAQSLLHDHVPAEQLGLARAWIDRQNLAGGGAWGATAPAAHRPEVQFRFHTLAEMADAVEQVHGTGGRAEP